MCTLSLASVTCGLGTQEEGCVRVSAGHGCSSPLFGGFGHFYFSINKPRAVATPLCRQTWKAEEKHLSPVRVSRLTSKWSECTL